ncbi:MAG: hypothetical protein LBS25_09035 [Candidatus Symbiothrix sp.]|jgi:hypothetical protein|nr:hypothetical protein [Candidatus Symbiothrix sp.]
MNNLIEKYFEGSTSLDDEQRLRDYFQNDAVAEEWKIYQPMFQYFSSERKLIIPPRRNVFVNNRLRWISIAASLLLLLGGYFVYASQHSPDISQIYIDGEKYTDVRMIGTETVRTLESLAETNNDILSSQIEALNIFLDNN